MEVYLDNSATTPLLPTVVEAMQPYWSNKYGNPSSPHRIGIEGDKTLTQCRLYLAQLLGVNHNEIIFTSSGTEANNLAIQGFAYNQRQPGHIITTNIEHPSVLQVVRHLQDKHGWEISYLQVNNYGFIDLVELEEFIKPETRLISIGFVNNEIGTIQDIPTIGNYIASVNKNRQDKIVFHVDAVQAFGHIPLDINKNNIHLLSLSGHKIFGPKGVGLLYCHNNIRLQPLLFGGGQEHTLRSGTENLPAIVGFTKASQLTVEEQTVRIAKLSSWKNQLLERLKVIPDHFFNSPPDSSPHIINLGFIGIKSEVLVHFLEQKGIYVSMGAACSGRRQAISHVLQAIALNPEQAGASIRISLSPFHSEEEIAYAGKVISDTVQEIRTIYR